MKTKKLPKSDSVRELARFWDSHDLTDFDRELREVTEPVFAAEGAIRLNLDSRQAKAVRQIADSKGISQAELIHEWVLQKLARRKKPGHARS